MAAPQSDHSLPYSISISVAPSNEAKLDAHRPDAVPAMTTEEVKQARHRPQPTLTIRSEEPPRRQQQQSQGTLAHSDSTTGERDRRFDQFKTLGGRLERQLSSIRGGSQHPAAAVADDDDEANRDSEAETDDDSGEVPTADRYFAALEGPELETLRATEVPVLPSDETWPFLLRFPISAFGMCMGVSSQAMLWKTLEQEPSTAFLGVSPSVNDVLWCVSAALMALVSFIYLLKAVFYFEAVRREFHHPIRVNFFFAPWIACLFLAKGLPEPVTTLHHAVWYQLMAPILILDLKMYGQWMSGGEWRLSRVASPTSHLAVVGNFVGALLGARMGLREPALFFFAVGSVHYVVLFVTLYQRLPTNVPLPRDLHPVFFLFVATPSVASVAWARISGEFGLGARLAYYVSLFLYASLVARVSFFFRGVRFSLAWWAYTFPVTSAAIATAVYASAMTSALTQALSVGLSAVASVTVAGVLATTVYRAFVRRDLFPNDVSIAIRRRPKAKFGNILKRIRTSSADLKDLVVSRHGGGSASETSSVSEPPTPMVYGRGRAEP
ncbi:S-type anion channel SLAH2 [Sorghum bicolor]|jgi:tellurite resistance protein TehA-like permease|nr:S-type anion channel SLAH2 [Sorghum bicolor]|eukprot:XP_002440339.2 S-type anion channel SLAH2 [Sorghum bicolor]